MKGFSNLLITVSGIAASPFLIYLLSRYISDAYAWVPFLIVLLFAIVLGLGLLKGAGIGLIIGGLIYGAFLVWYQRGLDWLPPYVQHVRKPF
jgi:hypothetical protein